MKEWTKLELEVIDELLEELGDRFSNDGCNDIDGKQLQLAEILNLDIDEEDDQISSNSGLVDYFQDKLKNINPRVDAVSDAAAAEIRLLKKQIEGMDYDNRQLQKRIKELEKLEYAIDLIKKVQAIKL